MFTLTRSEHNPILSPISEHPWESTAAFNASPIIRNKKLYLVYRAMSRTQLLKEPRIKTSTIARAIADKDHLFSDRKPLILPDAEFDKYGCEDPRVTKLGSTYYIFYTALGGHPFSKDNIKVAVALSKDLETITEKHLVTPFNAKAMAMFPEKINGKIAALVTTHTDERPSYICLAQFEREEDMWSPAYWNEWHANLESHKLAVQRQPDDHVELGSAPLKTKKGWLVIYAHIQKYGQQNQVFGIEALLLDPKNPQRIIGRTKGPFMVPEAHYEEVGEVPHTIFPSGALIRGNTLEIHYGAADTHCAIATIPLDNFLASLTEEQERLIVRAPGNPIITPRPGMEWETRGTINPAAVDLNGTIYILYRAISSADISTIGLATSKDGFTIEERLDKPIYAPRADFESKGCEDPRIMHIGDRLHMLYTAYDGVTPRLAATSILVKDFVARNFAWTEPQVITPPSIANKDGSILPEPINGKYLVFHRVNESICADYVDSLDFSKHKINECIEIVAPRRGMWDNTKVGISTPPIKTPDGWLFLYHGISWSRTYRVGAVFLDPEDPTIVRARSAVPIFEPQADYERKGPYPNVVFPCGLVIRNKTAFLYYGAADAVTGVATFNTTKLFKTMKI